MGFKMFIFFLFFSQEHSYTFTNFPTHAYTAMFMDSRPSSSCFLIPACLPPAVQS